MIGKLVKAQGEKGRAVHGKIVGESEDKTCWIIKKTSGYMDKWNKCYCTIVKTNEASREARKIVMDIRIGPDKIYGDSDL